jgi:mono/diheme cytochrome c family protein
MFGTFSFMRPRPAFLLLACASFALVLFAFDACSTAPAPVATTKASAAADAAGGPSPLERSFGTTVHPFIQTYCVSCHGGDKPEGDLNLSAYDSMLAVTKDFPRWDLVGKRVKLEEMPPDDAKRFPSAEERKQIADWITAVGADEAKRHAGDPGLVLARRLSNAEFDYSVRDLTGVDIKPAREFPDDPSNMAGFDNSGESLVMSPALLNKYLGAAREVANHMFLKPGGFAFAPYPMLVETDRDKYCVMQIINFYHQQDLDYADYFQAAWRFRHRAELGRPTATLADFAASAKVSPKYLTTIWATLEGPKEDAGPLAKLQAMWQALPAPVQANPDSAGPGCREMRDYVVRLRKKVEPRFLNIVAGGVTAARQPLLIWKDVQYATHRRTFDPAQLQVEGEPPPVPSTVPEPDVANAFGPGRTQLVKNKPGDPDLAVPAGQRARYEAAFARFCSVFPDMFYKEARGRNYFDTSKDQGRYLSAGFHNVMGYFRDDQPFYELLLDDRQQKELDEMWLEMDFVASTTARMYSQFSGTGEARGNLQVATTAGTDDPAANAGIVDDNEPASGAAPADKEVTSEARIMKLKATFLTLAQGGNEVGIKAVGDYFDWINATIRGVEKARLDAEPGQLESLLQFAAKAYRRPLTKEEKADLLAYYRSLRDKDGLDHEGAMRELVVNVLMAPDFCYRIDLGVAGPGIRPLSDYDLASRMSYFLWSSLPDDELLAHAAQGDLHEPAVIVAQAQRMLKDPRVRALTLEFGGNWLDFRHFDRIGTVDLERFPSFTNDLKAAMLEEPLRFMMDVVQNNRPILDFLYAKDTFVNPPLARLYGIPVKDDSPDGWTHIADASPYGRGGLLPMAVFLTKNAPGLRTSPVKRGNWVVKNVLGERIPPPPPTVPELPHDEAKMDLPLRDMLAQHRANPSCAACHARFDSLGLVFEQYGQLGELRQKDLAGRAIDASATFPGGSTGTGLKGLQQYLHDKRQDDFVDNFCRKMLAYALGRSLIPSDEALVREMHARLVENDYRFDNLVSTIVASPQFLTKRGRDDLAQK